MTKLEDHGVGEDDYFHWNLSSPVLFIQKEPSLFVYVINAPCPPLILEGELV